MSKEIWLTFDNNREYIQLPVNPPELSVGNGSQNESFNVSRLGEVTVIQEPKAKTFSFESFFPAMPGPYLDILPDDLKPPWLYVLIIDTWKNSGQPVRFLITESDINYLCSIEDFSYSEKAGDVDTIHYSLALKEYNIVTPRKLEQKNGKLISKNKPKRPGAK